MLFNHKQAGNYVPQILSQSLPNNFKPIEAPCYIAQAAGNIPIGFTGTLFNKVHFINGIAHCRTLYDLKLAITRGCIDITPEDYKEALDNRTLNKILVIRNAAFGDCLMLTPALRALREKYPHATIHVFGRKDSRVVYENLPFIDGILSIRETELASLVDDYDEVFDLIHIIECRPEADYMNALDIAAKILGVEVKDPKPIYNISRHEFEEARKLLYQMGLIPGKDKIVIFQAEATAQVRTLPYKISLIVANQLAMEGYKVVFVGHDMNLPGAKILTHQDKQGNIHRIAEPVPRGIETVLKSSKQGDKEYQVVNNHPNILFGQLFNHSHKERVRFATGAFADLIIAVDSFWSHLAAALGKPSVTIYSNYHPFTRTKYYDHTSIVTPDYSKVPCGPCNSLFNTCPMFEKQTAPCIGSVTPKSILDAAHERLKQTNSLYQEMRDTPPATFEDPRDCPMCGSTRSAPVTCKGSYIYAECHHCKSLFTIKYPDSVFWKQLKGHIKKNPNYRRTRNQEPAIFINAISEGFKNCDLKLPTVPIVDLISTSDKFHNRKSWKDYYDKKLKQVSESSNESIESELTIWVDGLMEVEKPIESLAGILDRISPGSYLVLINPISDKYDKINTWKPLNACVAGLHSIIPSQKSFRILFEKDIGLLRDDCKLIFINSSEEVSIILLQRTKESKDREISWRSISKQQEN